jgi:hypothetical protein
MHAANDFVPPRHLDDGFGRPACKVTPRGALIVEEPVHATCQACLVRFQEMLERYRRAGAL